MKLIDTQKPAARAAYDMEGNLHLLMEERRYYEDEETRELEVVIIDLALTQEGIHSEFYVLNITEETDDEEFEDYDDE